MSKNFSFDLNRLPAICDHSWKSLITETLPVNVETGEIDIGSGNYLSLLKNFIETDQTGQQIAKTTIILGNQRGKALTGNGKYAVIEAGQSLDSQNLKSIINNPNGYKSKKEIEDLKVKTGSKVYKDLFEQTKANNPARATEAIAKIDEFQRQYQSGEIKTADQFFNKIQSEPILEPGRIEPCGEIVRKLEFCQKEQQSNRDNIRLMSNVCFGVSLTTSLGTTLLPILLGLNPVGVVASVAITIVFAVIGLYIRSRDKDNQDNFMTECIQKK